MATTTKNVMTNHANNIILTIDFTGCSRTEAQAIRDRINWVWPVCHPITIGADRYLCLHKTGTCWRIVGRACKVPGVKWLPFADLMAWSVWNTLVESVPPWEVAVCLENCTRRRIIHYGKEEREAIQKLLPSEVTRMRKRIRWARDKNKDKDKGEAECDQNQNSLGQFLPQVPQEVQESAKKSDGDLPRVSTR